MIKNKTNSELLAELDKMVVGHHKAKKYLINLINRSRVRSYLKFVRGESPENLLPPGKLLLIGESGTGKTFLVQCIQKLLGFPICYIDATKMNPTGASGGIKSHDVSRMVGNAAKEYMSQHPGQYVDIWDAVDETVVFIDEIDKLAEAWESSGNWNKHVQSNFLTIFEHSSTDKILEGVTFIFAGAFNGLKKRRSIISKSIGFTKQDEATKEDDPINDEDVVQYGLIPELVGRISAIVELDKFTEENYYSILINKILPEKRRELEQLGIYGAIIGEDDLRAIVKKAIKSGQGVRALKRGLELFFLDLEFEFEKYLVN